VVCLNRIPQLCVGGTKGKGKQIPQQALPSILSLQASFTPVVCVQLMVCLRALGMISMAKFQVRHKAQRLKQLLQAGTIPVVSGNLIAQLCAMGIITTARWGLHPKHWHSSRSLLARLIPAVSGNLTPQPCVGAMMVTGKYQARQWALR
jgi:hypothetical protein